MLQVLNVENGIRSVSKRPRKCFLYLNSHCYFSGDHKSKAVINVLLDLLYDEDQDVRVVAAISLAHAASEIRNKQLRNEVVMGLVSK